MKEGFSVTIRTEEKSELNIGVFDVTIRVGDPCLICRNGKEKVRLEVETRLGRRHRVSLKVNPRATVRTQAVTSFSGEWTAFLPRLVRLILQGEPSP